METHKKIDVSLNEAREWYNSNNDKLKKIALQAFNKEELESENLSDIRTFEDACQTLYIPFDKITRITDYIEQYSKAAAALLRIFFIHKALNKGHKMPLDSGLKTPFPFVVMVETNTEAHKYYEKCKYVNQIGTLMVNGKYTIAYGGITATIGGKGCLNYNEGEYQPMALLFPCANTDIAEYLTRQFGMLLLQALYADTPEIQFNPTHP